MRLCIFIGCLLFLAGDAFAQERLPDPPPLPPLPKTPNPMPEVIGEPPPLPPPGVPRLVDRDKLRRLAYFPTVNAAFQTSLLGLPKRDQAKVEDPHKHIERLEKGLHGTPSDAEAYLELAELYSSKVQHDKAKAKAAELFRLRLKDEPANGWLHAQYARALNKKYQEAEKAALEAVRYAPSDWRCWEALGWIRLSLMYVSLYGSVEQVPWEKWHDPGLLIDELTKNKPAPARIAEAADYLKKAWCNFDRVVQLDRDEPDVYRTRMDFQILAVQWQSVFRVLQGQPPFERLDGILKTSWLYDSQQLARLCPDDPELLANLATAFMTVAIGKASPEELFANPGKAGFVKRLKMSPKFKQGIDEVMAKLEKLARSSQRAVAESASRNMALWHFLMGDTKESIDHARRSLTIDPTQKMSWDVLDLALDAEQREDEILKLRTERLAHVLTSESHLLLARYHFQHNDFDAAEGVLRTALKKYPKDIACWIGLAAILIRKSERADTLLEADVCLDRADKAFRESSADAHDVYDQQRLLSALVAGLVNRGIHCALTGDLASGWGNLTRALREAPADHAVREALDAFSD